MQRINLSVDMSDDNFLSEQIDNAIRGAVKAKTRELFNQEMEADVRRTACDELRRIVDGNSWRNSTILSQRVKDQINTQLNKIIGEIDVTKDDIDKHIERKLQTIDDKITYLVNKQLQTLSLEQYVESIVTNAVQKLYPEYIVQLIQSKEMDKLHERIRELEEENHRLKSGT